MIRPKLSPWLAAGFALAGINLIAEPASQPDAAAIAESQEVSDGKPGVPRLLSGRFKAAVSASLPRYETVEPNADENAEEPAPFKSGTNEGEVLRLPNFVVRDARPPKPEDVLSLEGEMSRYLGSKDGFDRGLLNRVVLRRDFGIATVLLFDAMRNDTRAKMMYRDEKRLQDRAELLDLTALLKEAAGGTRLKHELDDLFIRKPEFGRK